MSASTCGVNSMPVPPDALLRENAALWPRCMDCTTSAAVGAGGAAFREAPRAAQGPLSLRRLYEAAKLSHPSCFSTTVYRCFLMRPRLRYRCIEKGALPAVISSPAIRHRCGQDQLAYRLSCKLVASSVLPE